VELEGGADATGASRVRQRQARTPKSSSGTMDLETLDAWLERPKPAAKVDGVSMLDGYLAAIVIGPCSIPPNEWFFDLLGAKGNIASAHGKQLDAIMAIAARFNAISEILSTAPAKYAPIFQRADDGTVFAGPWCMGFTTAMKLRWKAWAPLLDSKGIECGLLLPIMLHSADQLAFPFGKLPQTLDAQSYLKTAYHDIPIVVPSIRDFWMPNRLAEIK
jgi:uncharacterized protein